jgi:hypothetical protein
MAQPRVNRSFTLHDWDRDGAALVATIHKAIKSERRHIRWQKWSVAIYLVLFAYQLGAWFGVFGASGASYGFFLFTAAMLLFAIAELAMKRSAPIAVSLMLVAFVTFGFAIFYSEAGR